MTQNLSNNIKIKYQNGVNIGGKNTYLLWHENIKLVLRNNELYFFNNSSG